jgi:hypothetical protein
VSIVGWGYDKGRDKQHWIVRNSWGVYWVSLDVEIALCLFEYLVHNLELTSPLVSAVHREKWASFVLNLGVIFLELKTISLGLHQLNGRLHTMNVMTHMSIHLLIWLQYFVTSPPRLLLFDMLDYFTLGLFALNHVLELLRLSLLIVESATCGGFDESKY